MPPKRSRNGEQTALTDEVRRALDQLDEKDFEEIVETAQIKKKLKLDEA